MTNDDVLSALPARRGHFLLESGYHSDLWLTLDGLFVDQLKTAPLIEALAAKLRPYAVSAVCGPMVGGAFLAQTIASHLKVRFYYSAPGPAGEGLFKATYRLTPDFKRRVQGERVALVDDVMSAGSSMRATKAALDAAGAATVVVAALMTLGSTGTSHFAAEGLPVETLDQRSFSMWPPAECPLCRADELLVTP